MNAIPFMPRTVFEDGDDEEMQEVLESRLCAGIAELAAHGHAWPELRRALMAVTAKAAILGFPSPSDESRAPDIASPDIAQGFGDLVLIGVLCAVGRKTGTERDIDDDLITDAATLMRHRQITQMAQALMDRIPEIGNLTGTDAAIWYDAFVDRSLEALLAEYGIEWMHRHLDLLRAEISEKVRENAVNHRLCLTRR
ncbi:MAG: hypothetical protein IPI58_05755 [Alphaproteobacteria bacterium]|nr:MAG: hypothetical protein IPI58_05755 [Alphaproteobacteria bacterium]